METIKTMQCPSCGAEINAIDNNVPQVECTYCGSTVVNEAFVAKRDKSLIPDYIIPFTTTEKDVINRIIESLLRNEKVEVDIFQTFKIEGVKKHFVPMYLFDASIDVSWSCTQIIRKERKVGDRKERYEEYYPASGTAYTGISMFFLTECGCDWMKTKIENQSTHESEIRKFDDGILDNDINKNSRIYQTSSNANEIWNKRSGDVDLDHAARGAARRSAPSPSKDFNYSWRSSWKSKLVLVPIWSISYSYKSKEYEVIADGVGVIQEFSYPQCTDDKLAKAKEEIEVENQKSSKGALWGFMSGIAAFLLFYPAVLSGGFWWLFFIATVVASFFCFRYSLKKDDVVNNAKQELRNRIKDVKKKDLERYCSELYKSSNT